MPRPMMRIPQDHAYFTAKAGAWVVAAAFSREAVPIVVINVPVFVIINPVVWDLLAVDPNVRCQIGMGELCPCVNNGHDDF